VNGTTNNMSGASPTGKPDADAPVPLTGTEQAADQASKQQQQPPPAESSTTETVGNIVEGVLDGVDVVGSVLDIFS
jgi:hypothetical protein